MADKKHDPEQPKVQHSINEPKHDQPMEPNVSPSINEPPPGREPFRHPDTERAGPDEWPEGSAPRHMEGPKQAAPQPHKEPSPHGTSIKGAGTSIRGDMDTREDSDALHPKKR